MDYRQAYEETRKRLEAAGIDEAKLDARLILEYVCHTDRNDLLVHSERPVSGTEAASIEALAAKRAARIPFAYLTGEQEFMGLSFLVNEHVLIPRQDTEILVEEVMRGMWDGMRILDVCTGSGCILLSLLHYSNECSGMGTDLSKDALKVAVQNAARLGLDAEFVQGDLFEKVEGKFDLIVSNPPYIKSSVIPELMEEVKSCEPLMALDGHEDGLFFYRRLIAEAGQYLQDGGQLFFEIGYDQAEAVSGMLRSAGYGKVEVIRDYAGLDRVVKSEKKL